MIMMNTATSISSKLPACQIHAGFLTDTMLCGYYKLYFTFRNT